MDQAAIEVAAVGGAGEIQVTRRVAEGHGIDAAGNRRCTQCQTAVTGCIGAETQRDRAFNGGVGSCAGGDRPLPIRQREAANRNAVVLVGDASGTQRGTYLPHGLALRAECTAATVDRKSTRLNYSH